MTDKGNRNLGVLFILSPFILLFLTLVSYAVFTFVFNSVVSSGGSSTLAMFANVMRLLFSLAGVISLLMFVIGPIVGIILIIKAGKTEKQEPAQVETPSAE